MGLLIDATKVGQSAEAQLKSGIVKNFSWFEVYDFICHHISFLPKDIRKERIKQYNELLEQEKSGYRIVANEIAPITNETEIKCIEQAVSSPYISVNQHIQKALMCCIINGKNSTLNKAIEKLKSSGVHIHSALAKAFISLYAYTCDEKGIRHAGIEFIDAPEEDAKYMLISCSAFINYLIEKWSKVCAQESSNNLNGENEN